MSARPANDSVPVADELFVVKGSELILGNAHNFSGKLVAWRAWCSDILAHHDRHTLSIEMVFVDNQ